MLRVNKETLEQFEKLHPGIGEQIRSYEKADLPACSRCGSRNTADVQCGLVGRSIHLAAATTKVKLIANGPGAGGYFCNKCKEFF